MEVNTRRRWGCCCRWISCPCCWTFQKKENRQQRSGRSFCGAQGCLVIFTTAASRKWFLSTSKSWTRRWYKRRRRGRSIVRFLFQKIRNLIVHPRGLESSVSFYWTSQGMQPRTLFHATIRCPHGGSNFFQSFAVLVSQRVYVFIRKQTLPNFFAVGKLFMSKTSLLFSRTPKRWPPRMITRIPKIRNNNTPLILVDSEFQLQPFDIRPTLVEQNGYCWKHWGGEKFINLVRFIEYFCCS